MKNSRIVNRFNETLFAIELTSRVQTLKIKVEFNHKPSYTGSY